MYHISGVSRNLCAKKSARNATGEADLRSLRLLQHPNQRCRQSDCRKNVFMSIFDAILRALSDGNQLALPTALFPSRTGAGRDKRSGRHCARRVLSKPKPYLAAATWPKGANLCLFKCARAVCPALATENADETANFPKIAKRRPLIKTGAKNQNETKVNLSRLLKRGAMPRSLRRLVR